MSIDDLFMKEAILEQKSDLLDADRYMKLPIVNRGTAKEVLQATLTYKNRESAYKDRQVERLVTIDQVIKLFED